MPSTGGTLTGDERFADARMRKGSVHHHRFRDRMCVFPDTQIRIEGTRNGDILCDSSYDIVDGSHIPIDDRYRSSNIQSYHGYVDGYRIRIPSGVMYTDSVHLPVRMLI